MTELTIGAKNSYHIFTEAITFYHMNPKDYKKCYTCKKEFDGHWNLMQHRKFNHPSNRKCRDYPEKCIRGSTCWYIHTEEMEVDNSPNVRFNCNFCDFECERKNALMEHKKEQHPSEVNFCSKFVSGTCFRDVKCWYRHPDSPRKASKHEKPKNLSFESENPDFHKAQTNLFPPDQMTQIMKMFANLSQKMQKMEEKMTEVMKHQ